MDGEWLGMNWGLAEGFSGREGGLRVAWVWVVEGMTVNGKKWQLVGRNRVGWGVELQSWKTSRKKEERVRGKGNETRSLRLFNFCKNHSGNVPKCCQQYILWLSHYAERWAGGWRTELI